MPAISFFTDAAITTMNYDWKALAPHKPLDPGSNAYVSPPGGGARSLAGWVSAGGSTLLVGGPAGIGKSTELAQAAKILQTSRVACLVPLDRLENIHRLTPARLLLRVALRVADIAERILKLPLSNDLLQALARVRTAPLESEAGQPLGDALVLTRSTLLEVERLSVQSRITLLIDGLEKVASEEQATELFEALGMLPEQIELAVVIPWSLAFGPRGGQVIRPGEHFLALRAVDTDVGEGQQFLERLLALRLDQNNSDTTGIVAEAIRWSGGIPRIFLQLLADAAIYAQLRDNRSWPEAGDLVDAVADMQDSFRRLLLPGDTQAILEAERTDGRELELRRKVRLMAHGILLEKSCNGFPCMSIHPLVLESVRSGGRHA